MASLSCLDKKNQKAFEILKHGQLSILKPKYLRPKTTKELP